MDIVRRSLIAVAAWGLAMNAAAGQIASAARAIKDAFTPAIGAGAVFAVRFDADGLRRTFDAAGAVVVEGFPLTGARQVDLEVERFWVTSPGARFALGGGLAGDRALAFDPGEVVLLRGRVRGVASSHVFLGLSKHGSNGVIDLGPGRGRFGVSSRSAVGGLLSPGIVSVFAGGSDPSPASFCTVIGREEDPPPTDTEPVRGLRQVQLAVETDNEYFRLFPSAEAAAAYIVELYGAGSDIFMRDASVRLDLTYVRLWPTGNVPFATGLSGFQAYWNANMQSVPRDVAQMFSGRADLPGGVAYLSALCGSSAYSFTGNAVGYFADPASASVLNYDVQVTTHELGHNFGTNHTDSYGIDTCNQVTTPPQRGTIMSYCNQTVSGGMSVIDLRFHKITQDRMRQYLATAPCLAFDCNQNGVSDALDISTGASQDANTNGVPDECEDCNHNGVLDGADIAVGTSFDRNSNGVPDECEPDCNANGFPDEMDIRLGVSEDRHGDTVPDECEANLNGANGSDYSEIMANMTLDKNRDRVLDSVQDCDGDQTPDLEELQGAWDVWAASLQGENTLREFHAVTGVLMRVGDPGAVAQGQDLIVTPDRRVLVSSGPGNSVVEFDRLGHLIRTLVPPGTGGLLSPAGMALSPTGTLLVCSGGGNSVLEYSATTGAFLRAFVPPGSGGLSGPFGLTFGPGGNLFVTSSNNQVIEYHGTTGTFVRVFVSAAGNGGLSSPRGLVFNPRTGSLLVASYGTDQLLEYNGSTGAFIRNWLVTGLPVDGPWGVRVGPDGFIYVSRNGVYRTHVTRARIFIFDPRNGYFVRACVQGLDSGLDLATGFDFMPGNLTDCNRNLLPDSCDIASGRSLDRNGNGRPDECESFCYANCDSSTALPVLNVADFTCFLQRYTAGCAAPYSCYPNCDASTASPFLNIADFTCFLQKFAGGCP